VVHCAQQIGGRLQPLLQRFMLDIVSLLSSRSEACRGAFILKPNLRLCPGRPVLRSSAVRFGGAGRAVIATTVGACAVLAGGAARAQSTSVVPSVLQNFFPSGVPGYGSAAGVTVPSRQRPEFDPLGVRAGSFIIRPEVTQSFGYNSNATGTPHAKSSAVSETEASVAANSDWGRNSLGALLTVDSLNYLAQSSQNQTAWTASGGGTYDFGRDTLAVAASHQNLFESSNSINNTGLGEPLPFTLDDFRASYTTQFGRYTFTPNIGYSLLRFGNLPGVSRAGVIGVIGSASGSQSFQNRNILVGGVTTRYEFAPNRDAVLDIRGTNVNYINPQANLFGPSRSGNAVTALAGIEYVSSAVWTYRVLVGYQQREFSSPQYKAHGAPIGEASVFWTPEPRDTVSFRFIRGIEDAADANTSGYVYTGTRLSWDHEYLRNVLLQVYGGFERAAYLQSPDIQSIYEVGGSVTYLINRNVRLTGSYGYTNQQTNFGSNYAANVALLQVHLGI
jgi:hypothetical protein